MNHKNKLSVILQKKELESLKPGQNLKQQKKKSKNLFYVIQKMGIIPKFLHCLTNLKFRKTELGKSLEGYWMMDLLNHFMIKKVEK